MKVQRRNALRIALFSSLAFALIALTLPDLTTAQQKQGTAAPLPTPVPGRSGRLGQESEQVTINTDLITLTVTVTDSYGRYVSGLDQSAFTVFDDKAPQEITFLAMKTRPSPSALSSTCRVRWAAIRSGTLVKRSLISSRRATIWTSIS
jgi:hypothetical protein